MCLGFSFLDLSCCPASHIVNYLKVKCRFEKRLESTIPPLVCPESLRVMSCSEQQAAQACSDFRSSEAAAPGQLGRRS